MSKEGLNSILDDLFTGKKGEPETKPDETPEEKKDETPAAEPETKPEAKSEEEMTDEELALSVSVDLPEPSEEEKKPGAEKDSEPEEKKPAPKQRTAEEAKKIREEAEADVRALREAFPELSGLRGLGELQDPTKYLAYRKKGLTAEEAYTLAYAGARRQQSAGGTTKPPLRSSPSGGAGSGTVLSAKETREISAQTGLTPEEIKKYYRKY